MSIKDLKAKLSGIRSQVEDLHMEAHELWVNEKDAGKEEDLGQFLDDLVFIEASIAELED